MAAATFLSNEQKLSYVKQARQLARLYAYELGYEVSKTCLLHAYALAAIMKRDGIDTVPQAGTLSWKFVDDEHDDGISPNWFHYQWEGITNKHVQAALMRGQMPEMHVWVGIPETQELVDITTCFLKKQVKDLIGAEWKAADPPDYLWCNIKKIPDGVVYHAKADAIITTISMVEVVQSVLMQRQQAVAN